MKTMSNKTHVWIFPGGSYNSKRGYSVVLGYEVPSKQEKYNFIRSGNTSSDSGPAWCKLHAVLSGIEEACRLGYKMCSIVHNPNTDKKKLSDFELQIYKVQFEKLSAKIKVRFVNPDEKPLCTGQFYCECPRCTVVSILINAENKLKTTATLGKF